MCGEWASFCAVQVVEQMQAVDNGDSMEDLLQAVAERVQQRQAVRQQQQSAKPAMKVRGLGGKGVDH